MKKRLSILSFALLSCISIFSQERVYISTDKDCYVAGDRIWCSAFCMDLTQKPMVLSNFSSTVYLELQTNTSVAQVAKLALDRGRGAGALELPADLPTGNYRLLAYTAHNKNEKGFSPQGKVITIFNALSNERVKDNVVLSEVEPSHTDAQKTIIEGYNAVFVTTPQSCLKKAQIPISIKNISDQPVSLSVSIFHQDGLGAEPVSNIAHALTAMNSIAVGEVSNTVVPDYEGEVIKLRTTGVKDGTAHVSFPGKDYNYFASKIDSMGRFSIYTPNIYGDKDLICEIASPSQPSSWSVEIEEPFIREVQGGIPQLSIGENMTEKLQKRGLAMQVERRFEADTLYQRLPVRINTYLNGPYFIYPLDEYTRFPLMEEVIIEFVKELRIRKVNKVPKILVTTNERSMVLLDGVPVFDHQKIIDYDPLLVKEIRIYPGYYSSGELYSEGVACFNTYKGDLPSYTFSDNVKILPFRGSLVPLSFTGATVLDNKKYPDYRQTIYWHPIVEVSSGESYEFKCVTPAYSGTFDIVVEGITQTGNPIYFKSSFTTL